MPSIKILRNIGTVDCATLGLDPSAAKEGQAIQVSQEVCDELLRCGLGEFEEQEAPHHQTKQQAKQNQPQR